MHRTRVCGCIKARVQLVSQNFHLHAGGHHNDKSRRGLLTSWTHSPPPLLSPSLPPLLSPTPTPPGLRKDLYRSILSASPADLHLFIIIILILFHFILFYSILLYFILFHLILLYSILFYLILFLFYFIYFIYLIN